MAIGASACSTGGGIKGIRMGIARAAVCPRRGSPLTMTDAAAPFARLR
jgi:hypothetical protein